MSYLQQILNTPKVPTIRTHNSVESLVKAFVPLNEKNEEPKLKEPLNEIEKVKNFAENVLLTNKEKLDIEAVNEEIEKDLREAFLNEGVSFQEAAAQQSYYKLYRDRDETFECKISVEGTSLGNSSVRLSLESDQWNIFFVGKIYRDGRCVVPLKKMSIFQEGTIGKARLEVIIDDTIFVPWEETFIVEGAKKVTVEIKPQTKVSVNLKDDE